MMQEVEVLKTIQELICSFFSEEQFTLSDASAYLCFMYVYAKMCLHYKEIKLALLVILK